ncbi:hypothetical protein PtrSN002B_000477 [Pyrenophora tritici-repentis]|uniref:Uncharacterized protein n=1 Tax=Pyrenophora tritici-repentis (strain Pt-1C-BFP) TaxID=426418 RepID=B2VQV6_PYRTR|nr:uncharacterized protein PTRG_00519 [Pyrenophora tritici-repentis Pt-1C-BFP]KAA8625126.1 hypothetical protein PtrV1_00806 [Pyrenophora tritici-repentis]EDU39957.1 conserved hypothetical protein [Pyrenophora tritici-repentis Pt-1C-BFP]KAI1549517.1 hypothetical protein PtrSN001A_000818 [Pyrenophora tritici-repentis]KAI1553309.1 hypothetical protein PtrSN001C_000235 [Pyrenophora tritici-repentis]KAI1558388.1 hypothetical protein PtrSN002B_000477 [Pyrenophora tritici-repentis]
MRFSTIIAATILGAANMAYAGHNCKCQDPSGTGPQWDGLTQQVCNEQSASQNLICGTNIIYHPQEHHQCTSSLNCLNSGAFNDRCRQLGAPGAYCWG